MQSGKAVGPYMDFCLPSCSANTWDMDTYKEKLTQKEERRVGRRVVELEGKLWLNVNLESLNPGIPLPEMTTEIIDSVYLLSQMRELATSEIKQYVPGCKNY